ncbi:hypothetical protein KKB40_04760 [Patescibacteria group bacterium]|nr:hypothetical protein [Patescibacteria group bacterium]
MNLILNIIEFSKRIIIKIKPEHVYVFVFLLFLIKGVIFLDPDFGWRLKAGEMYLTSGIPATDPFTYTMPSFPWVDHAWLQSTAFAFFYSLVGKFGLTIISLSMAILALIISFNTSQKKAINSVSSIARASLGDYGLFGNIAFLLSTYILFVFYGVRAQVMSWLMMAILLNVTLNFEKWKKRRMLMLALFLFWANLHGSFALGILIMSFVCLMRMFRQRKFDLTDTVLITASFLVTLINPYRLGVWREVASSVFDSGLRWTINEWMPSLMMLNLPMVVVIAFSTTLVWKQRRTFKLEELILYFAFLLQAIASRRHLPLWTIIALPMTTSAIDSFFREISKIKGAVGRLKKAYKFAWLGVLLIVFFQLAFDFREVASLKEEAYYPKDAVLYLRANFPQGEIFSNYGWGGYLIWKLPEKKVFIDGRMPSWKWEPKSDEELASAFGEYMKILKGESDYKETFEKLGVDTVLWPVSREENAFDDFVNKAEDFLVKFGREKQDFDFIDHVENDSWKKVYEDEVAVIFKKNS